MIPKGNQYINILSKSYMIVYNWFQPNLLKCIIFIPSTACMVKKEVIHMFGPEFNSFSL